MIDKTKIIMALVIIFLLVISGAALKAWYGERNKPVMSKIEYIKAPEPPKAKKIKRATKNVNVEVLDLKEAKAKLNLPSDYSSDIIATAELPESESGYDVLATINSGKGYIETKEKKRPFFEFENIKEIGGRVGYTTKDYQQVITGFGRWQFLRIGNFHLGLYAKGDSQGEAIGQLELTYRF